jgi:hypothetical protein
VIRRTFALLLVAGCPGSDDSGDDGPASGPSTEASTGAETGAELCPECDADPACHSYAGGGHCVCEAGYEWAEDDIDDFTCIPIPPREGEDACLVENHARVVDGACSCDPGYNWCTDDTADLTCCPDAGQGTEDTG